MSKDAVRNRPCLGFHDNAKARGAEDHLENPGVYVVRQNDLSVAKTTDEHRIHRKNRRGAYSSTFNFNRNSPTWV